MPERLTDERLAAIRPRLANAQEDALVQRDGDVWLTDAAQTLLDEDVPALLDEVDALRADAKRLEWLCETENTVVHYRDGRWYIEVDAEGTLIFGATYREAVDNAMEALS